MSVNREVIAWAHFIAIMVIMCLEIILTFRSLAVGLTGNRGLLLGFDDMNVWRKLHTCGVVVLSRGAEVHLAPSYSIVCAHCIWTRNQLQKLPEYILH